MDRAGTTTPGTGNSRSSDALRSAPLIGRRLDTEFIQGMRRQDDRVIIVLEIDKVFSAEEISLARAVPAEQAQ